MSTFAHHEFALRGVVQTWWRGLQGLNPGTGDEIPGLEPKRAELARLRRIATAAEDGQYSVALVDAFAVNSFLDLWRRVAEVTQAEPEDALAEYAAVAAVTLARVRIDAGRTDTASMLGDPRDTPVFAETRFRRLIRTEQAANLFDQGRRITAILGATAPVGELGASLILWRDPKVRRRWTFSYYHLRDVPAEPPGSPPDTGAIA
jgi:CRISPR type I-E-associated protein CasB/Cse2